MEFFSENGDIFAKSSILDVWRGSDYLLLDIIYYAFFTTLELSILLLLTLHYFYYDCYGFSTLFSIMHLLVFSFSLLLVIYF